MNVFMTENITSVCGIVVFHIEVLEKFTFHLFTHFKNHSKCFTRRNAKCTCHVKLLVNLLQNSGL